MPIREVRINRAPVLTLWAAVVAEALGFEHETALTLGRAVAGLDAHAKGESLGIFRPRAPRVHPDRPLPFVELLGRRVAVVRTPRGLRALQGGRSIDPERVERYLIGKFGDDLDDVRRAMTSAARQVPPGVLAAQAFAMYERFRPQIPAGRAGWGARGTLSLAAIKAAVTRAA